MIDDGPIHEPGETRCTIDLTFPLRGPGGTEENKMPETKERFGFSVSLLLLSESGQRKAPVVPDDGRRTKADDLALLLQTPAEIHIIASLVVFRIKSTDFFESPFVEGHIAAGNVLRNDIGQEHMIGPTGRSSYAGLDPVLGGRREFGPPTPAKSPLNKVPTMK